MEPQAGFPTGLPAPRGAQWHVPHRQSGPEALHLPAGRGTQPTRPPTAAPSPFHPRMSHPRACPLPCWFSSSGSQQYQDLKDRPGSGGVLGGWVVS